MGFKMIRLRECSIESIHDVISVWRSWTLLVPQHSSHTSNRICIGSCRLTCYALSSTGLSAMPGISAVAVRQRGDSTTSADKTSKDGGLSSITGLYEDFAQSCAVEDSRGEINLTFSLPINSSNNEATATLHLHHNTETPSSTQLHGDDISRKNANSDLDECATAIPVPIMRSHSGLSYAAMATSSVEVIPKEEAVPKESAVEIKKEEQMVKIAIGPQHFDLLKLIGACEGISSIALI